LEYIINEEWFNQVRNKEGFGYIVSSHIMDLNEPYLSKYYVFLIQSVEKKVDEMISRTKKFIDEFYIKLKTITNEEITNVINGCIEPLEAPFASLEDKMNYIFTNEIETHYYKFDSIDILINTYKKITKTDIINFYEKYFINRKSAVIALESQYENNEK
jgi:secreted Zn-dependent insulinase-like peptidase